jgi:AraC family transcriptional regulator of adaptative response/methylated-DNA-[protein]-cysteine methyltransferase
MQDGKIVYRDIDSPLGPMIAGATSRGVCFLEWHDRGGVERIKQRVEKRYKTSPVPGNNTYLDLLEVELHSFFCGELERFTVAVDVTGTAFERKVWDKLLEIPHGETRSYGQLAAELGKPGAARAVGGANGANYLALVIPCHRVIEANGGVGGYGGKIWRKKKLLELESFSRNKAPQPV